MRTITLRGTGITTTALGFGTSTLLGRLSKKESTRLLEVAYESGIRHFDTAPLYGYGEAEGVLGRFLQARKDATVATKFGLSRSGANSACQDSFLFRRIKDLGRPLLRMSPQLRARARDAVHTSLKKVTNFDVAEAERSLTNSLKLLKRSQVDLFFLHECRISDLADERLLAFLNRSKEAGLVRAFGIATDIDTINACEDANASYMSVLQFPNNPFEPNLETYSRLADRACIIHSPFGGFGIRSVDDKAAALAYARRQNPDGIVLFSSQQSGHIVSNAGFF